MLCMYVYIYIYIYIYIYGAGLQPHPPVMVMVSRPPVGMGGSLVFDLDSTLPGHSMSTEHSLFTLPRLKRDI